MRGYLSWFVLSVIACAIAVGAAFSFGASGFLIARAAALGTIDPVTGLAATAVGVIGTLGTPASAGLWMAAAVRTLVRSA